MIKWQINIINSLGKTEMWYIMDSDENAEIIMGLKEQMFES